MCRYKSQKYLIFYLKGKAQSRLVVVDIILHWLVYVCQTVNLCVCVHPSFSKLDLRARRTVVAERVGSILKDASQEVLRNVTGLLTDQACVCVCVCVCVCRCVCVNVCC